MQDAAASRIVRGKVSVDTRDYDEECARDRKVTIAKFTAGRWRTHNGAANSDGLSWMPRARPRSSRRSRQPPAAIAAAQSSSIRRMHARSQNAREPRSGARNGNLDLFSCSSKSASALTCLCRQPTFSVIIWVASTRRSTAIVANRPCPRARGRAAKICKIFLNWGSSEILKNYLIKYNYCQYRY